MSISSLSPTGLPAGITPPSVATQPKGKAKAAPSGAAAADGAAPDASSLGGVKSAQEQSDRFLKLLVAQMSNQDPLNPMDSAQVTSQMAQISTVEGVQTLNKTVNGLNAQFTQLQTMQGAALVGHDVAVDGNTLRLDKDSGQGDGGFEIAQPATSVSVDVLNAAGQTVATAKLGPQPAGRHSFAVDVPEAQRHGALTFQVNAANGSTPLDASNLAYNNITAVSTKDGKLALELDNGRRVDYDAVRETF
jgi:flagellar basal-body rod modification protein FlgD